MNDVMNDVFDKFTLPYGVTFIIPANVPYQMVFRAKVNSNDPYEIVDIDCFTKNETIVIEKHNFCHNCAIDGFVKLNGVTSTDDMVCFRHFELGEGYVYFILMKRDYVRLE